MTFIKRIRDRVTHRRTADGDRGAVFIEFALAVPFLVVMGLGLVEGGMLWKASNDVTAVARNAARAGSSAPSYYTADRTILGSVGAELSPTQFDGLKRVIVFRANSAGQTKPPSTCLALTPATNGTGNSGSACNVYSKSQVQAVVDGSAPASRFSGSTSCPTGSWDRWWCPATRNRSMAGASLDYLGVYVEIKVDSTTGAGFGNQTFGRTSVFRLEPPFGAT